MNITLPSAALANDESISSINTFISAAEATFLASTTVLITNAISNGLFKVEPFLIPFVTSTYVNSVFQPLGYVVSFPIFPFNCGFEYPDFPCTAPAGFPEVLGNTWFPWNCNCGCDCGPPRISISWAQLPVGEIFFELETGGNIELEDSTDLLILE